MLQASITELNATNQALNATAPSYTDCAEATTSVRAAPPELVRVPIRADSVLLPPVLQNGKVHAGKHPSFSLV